MEYITATQAAKVLGISPSRVAYYVRVNRLHAEKVGHAWLILRSDLEAFAKQPRPKGWKKGRPRKVNSSK